MILVIYNSRISSSSVATEIRLRLPVAGEGWKDASRNYKVAEGLCGRETRVHHLNCEYSFRDAKICQKFSNTHSSYILFVRWQLYFDKAV